MLKYVLFIVFFFTFTPYPPSQTQQADRNGDPEIRHDHFNRQEPTLKMINLDAVNFSGDEQQNSRENICKEGYDINIDSIFAALY